MEKVLWGLCALALAVAALATLAFVTGLFLRPPVYGEAEVLHEARRLHDHLPLFTDPLAGAFDQGSYPSRVYVTYPPLWSAALSLVPPRHALVVGRALGLVAWYGLFAIVLVRAERERRRATALAVLYATGIFVIVLLGTTARPDAVALALAGASLFRAVRRGRADAVCGALFALAAWLKPNVLGMGAGVGVASLLAALERGDAGREARRALLGFALGASLVLFAVGAALHVASDGLLSLHLARSLAQRPTLDGFIGMVKSRALFVLPIAYVLWVAVKNRRAPGGALALFAFACALAWTLFSLAKPGSSSNYWMEPAVAMVAVISFARVRGPVATGARLLFALSATAHGVWLAVVAVGGVAEAFEELPGRNRVLAMARATCRTHPGDVVLSDSPGSELAMNDRVLMPAFQAAWLVKAGLFPAKTWADDVRRPEARCFVIEGGLLDAPPGKGDGAFPEEVRTALIERFALSFEASHYRVYRARE